MRGAACAALALGAIGCGGGGGATAVLLTLRASPDVPAGRLAAATSLAIAVGGAESYSTTLVVAGQLAGGVATVRYRPEAIAGTLDFQATVSDVQGPFAVGDAEATIVAGAEVPAEIVLAPFAVADGGVDLAAPDLAPIRDLSVEHDFARGHDLRAPDLSAPDLSAPDLSAPPDLTPAAPPFAASHVAASSYGASAGDLPSTVATIDTGAIALFDGAGQPVPLPAGARFAPDASGNAILSIGGWKVTAPVVVRGGQRLVVVAAGAVDVAAAILASATNERPGPGGATPDHGPGPGGVGSIAAMFDRPGGGGAGFGGNGASGGTTMGRIAGGVAGQAYGNHLGDWNGGSGGGDGAAASACLAPGGSGGGGGGAVQISSAVSIAVEAAGRISANGGGGRGGCYGSGAATGGGGGGSGGEIFLEAPSVTVAGGLFANGGAGGSGDPGNAGSIGSDGEDGQDSTVPATGGAGALSGSAGGNGGSLGNLPASGANGTRSTRGGGAGPGRIWLRTHGPQSLDTTNSTISPTPTLDSTL